MKHKFTALVEKFKTPSHSESQQAGETDSRNEQTEPTPLELVVAYHQTTKHHYYRFAAGPGYLDWETQPDPFRRYRGAPVIELDLCPPGESPAYEVAFQAGQIPPASLNRQSVSQLFFNSLAISAWKQAGRATWALRVNPSSGNLHPTEGYLLCGPVEGLSDTPVVCHYAPREHALERRAEFSLESWQTLSAGFPPNTLFVGLTSIHWREAWKYGERAFRYCQHDVGHAIAAISLAAAGLGWQATLLAGLDTEQVGVLLGVSEAEGPEAEHPDCLLAIYPQGQSGVPHTLPADVVETFADLTWQGRPNILSPDHVNWEIIDVVADASRKPLTPEPPTVATETRKLVSSSLASSPTPSLPQIIHQRRSALAMDGWTEINREVFYKILSKTLPWPGQIPFHSWPWPAYIHLGLFVHRVRGLEPGLYLLVRDPAQTEALQAAMKTGFAWETPPDCPAYLDLYRLATDDIRAIAAQVSCQQSIAANGCFSLGMLARFAEPLQQYGPWFYPRLFWESGLIGQVLYLEAEAAGIRGTGIGCFFDDAVHDIFGLEGMQFQSLYHFTMGGYVDDPRLTTLPAYPGR